MSTPASPEKKFIARPLIGNMDVASDEESSDDYGSERSFEGDKAHHYLTGRMHDSL